jgi:hypothetical protein
MHGFITIITGHGVTTHAQALLHGARVAIAVVGAAVLITKKRSHNHIFLKRCIKILC